MFHSLNALHVYRSRQTRVFRRLTSLLLRCINHYEVDTKYAVRRLENVSTKLFYFDNYVACNINNADIDKTMEPGSVKLNKVAKFPS